MVLKVLLLLVGPTVVCAVLSAIINVIISAIVIEEVRLIYINSAIIQVLFNDDIS